ncbi:apolipoprotein N-acyltransferase [Deinococcus radiophilus]|uniref:apolipoprotein N-acyltransferase n=1 Tax=Deinococcus radiophilus TaxID=32062 RepID=UPI00360F095F
MRRSSDILALSWGLVTAALTLTPWAWLSVLPLAVWLHHAAQADTARRMGVAAFAYTGLHLWWIAVLAAKIFGVPPLGGLALILYAIQGLFFAALGWLVLRFFHTPRARLWALAGGWVILEWLRTLGTLAFPWPTLGYVWLDTPVAQVAALGGLLLLSWLAVTTAVALADALITRRPWPLLTLLGLLGLSTAYGLTRLPAQGEPARAFLTRTEVDGFDRFSGGLLPELLSASQDRPAGEVLIWSETALDVNAGDQVLFPGSGISGAHLREEDFGRNLAVAIDSDGQILVQNDKGRPVPFGEAFPLQDVLGPLYTTLGGLTGFDLSTSIRPAQQMIPLVLEGIRYGVYICYDSVFSWPARQLTRQGAEVLVNVSNDSWYAAAGVQQHFNMGRVRAIENRRWVLRSVQRGWAGSVNDLGQPVQVLKEGTGGFSAEYQRLTGQTIYTRLGDAPVLLLALALILGAQRLNLNSDLSFQVKEVES